MFIQNNAIVCQSVDIRGRNLVRAVESNIVPSLKETGTAIMLIVVDEKCESTVDSIIRGGDKYVRDVVITVTMSLRAAFIMTN